MEENSEEYNGNGNTVMKIVQQFQPVQILSFDGKDIDVNISIASNDDTSDGLQETQSSSNDQDVDSIEILKEETI